MEFLERWYTLIKTTEDRDLYTYLLAFFGIVLLVLGMLIYFHYSRVSWYQNEFKKIETLRTQTKKILRDSKIVNAQKEHVEDILAQNKNFRIGEAYQTIMQKAGLGYQAFEQPTPITGETISGKSELLINSRFSSISMKQLTDLLSEIANVPQIYTKEVTIKKSPTMPTVDADITVATLEPSSTE